MGDDLNPFDPPKHVGESQSGPRKLTTLDWVIAIVLGFLAVVLSFFAVCFGLGVSVAAFAEDWLLSLFVFSLLFSLACGYLTFRNHLASIRHPRDSEMSPVKHRSFRLNSHPSGRSELGEVLFGCAIGMLALMLILPSLSILTEKLVETQNVSPHVVDYLQNVVRIVAVACSTAIGVVYWYRVAKSGDGSSS